MIPELRPEFGYSALEDDDAGMEAELQNECATVNLTGDGREELSLDPFTADSLVV